MVDAPKGKRGGEGTLKLIIPVRNHDSLVSIVLIFPQKRKKNFHRQDDGEKEKENITMKVKYN